MVAAAAKPCLKAVKTGGKTVPRATAYAGNIVVFLRKRIIAVGGPKHAVHIAAAFKADSGRGNVRVGRGSRNCGARLKTEPASRLRRYSAHTYTGHCYRSAHLFGYHIAQSRVERRKEVGGGEAALVDHIVALVRGVKISVRHHAGKEKGHPVSGFDYHVARMIYLRRFGVKLPYLREHPFARHLAAE